MLDVEYSVITSDVIKSFDCIMYNTLADLPGQTFLAAILTPFWCGQFSINMYRSSYCALSCLYSSCKDEPEVISQ